MRTTAYLSLGSNLGDRNANIHRALQLLEDLGRVAARSSLYQTEPVETTEEQPWFLNCAVALETELTPPVLLARILDIEQSMGRKRITAKGPRIIDIDVLLFGDAVLDTADLTIPHPGMHARRFVLMPLAEIAPEAQHPLLKRTAGELLQALPAGQAARKYEEQEAANYASQRENGANQNPNLTADDAEEH